MPIDLAAADELLSTTRAVRRRLDFTRKVPRAVVLDCIRLSQQAPTGGNSQGWRWVIVEDAAKRAALAELYRSAGAQFLAMGRDNAQAQGQAQTERVYESALFLADHLHEAPLHVIPCQQGRPTPGVEAGFFASIFPAVWSFQLALRARGLGSALTTLHLIKQKEAAALLGIPEDVTQCALLPVAYTLGTEFKPVPRPPPESIVHWDGWGGPA